METQKATYTKLLDGNWGLRLEGFKDIKEGEEIKVTTKSGAVRIEKVGKIFWHSDDRKVTLAKKADVDFEEKRWKAALDE